MPDEYRLALKAAAARARNHLVTFLRRHELGVPATNWPAERGIRPAVLIRKTWGANATWTGAGTQERLMSDRQLRVLVLLTRRVGRLRPPPGSQLKARADLLRNRAVIKA